MPMKNTCAILLAAGDQKQTLSRLLFRPLIRWAWDNCREAGIEDICVITDADPEKIRGELPQNALVLEKPAGEVPLSLSPAGDFLREHQDADALIIHGDAPFFFPQLLTESLALHREKGHAVTAVSAPGKGPLSACWLAGTHLGLLTGKTSLAPADLFRELKEQGLSAGEYAASSPLPGMRGGDPRRLAALTDAARQLIFQCLWDRGVEISVTDGVIIDPRAEIGPGTRILPGTVIMGETRVGANAVIGPNSRLEDAVIGDNCVVDATYILGAVLEEDVQIGPFCRVRPGSRLSAGVRIGNFVEVKNSVVGPGTKSAHLTYIGDADVGSRVNFGCGVCIANYDGVHKHRTVIGDDCFIGCNTNLVAPVTLGDGAYTAAGTTVTQDVPPDALCIARSRQTNLPDRAKEHRKNPR